uniref:Ultraviolet sensitive opsin 2 n=1 Tax=Tychius meliloti TaxID=879024 RepID=A0A8F2PE29_9CUCU|nr:ultraviolet sensitive opsin 2 [Tychius meliloti]
MGTPNWTWVPFYDRRIMEVEIQHNLGWNLGPEELSHIPDHWLVYPEPEKSLHILLAMFYVVFFVSSMTGNGLVLWIFTTSKALRTASNMFVVNLALFDLIMMTCAPMFIYNAYNQGYTSHLSCQIFAIIGSISGIGAGMTNAAIAYDRYATITSPFDGKVTRTKAMLICVFIWLYILPWTVMPALEVWGRFVPEGFLTTCSFDYLTRTFDNQLFVAVIFVCSYVFPMLAIIYFYSQIVNKVFSHEAALRKQAKKMNVESLRANQNQNSESVELRIAKAAIAICSVFVMAWTPYAVLALIGAFGDQSLLTPNVSMIPAVACKTVGSIDPYIYALSHPRFRLELQKRVPWLAIKEKDVSDTHSVATEQSAAPTATA